MDSTAVIFCLGSNTRRAFLVFITAPPLCIVNQFLVVVHQHLDPALFGTDHNALIAHATDHVKRIPGLSAKGKLQGVFLNALFQSLFKGRVDLKKPVGRTQPADALVGPLVIVILDPEGNARSGILVAGKLGPLQKLGQDALPETLDLAQRHGMMGRRADVLDPVLGKLLFKPRAASPVGVLASVVGEYLFGNAVFANGPAVSFDHVFGRLAAIKSQTGDIAAVVVNKPDQIGDLSRQTEGHNIALPHLVGPGPFKKSGLGRIFFPFAFCRLGQPLCAKRPLDGRLTGAHKEKPFEDISDAPGSISGIFLFQINDGLADSLRKLGSGRGFQFVHQPLFTMLAIFFAPGVYTVIANAELGGNQLGRVTVFNIEPGHFEPEFMWIGRHAARRVLAFV